MKYHLSFCLTMVTNRYQWIQLDYKFIADFALSSIRASVIFLQTVKAMIRQGGFHSNWNLCIIKLLTSSAAEEIRCIFDDI